MRPGHPWRSEIDRQRRPAGAKRFHQSAMTNRLAVTGEPMRPDYDKSNQLQIPSLRLAIETFNSSVSRIGASQEWQQTKKNDD